MSLILEALRKSEAERRRGLAPDVAMELPPTTASRPRAIKAWLLPALVAVALLMLAGWWMRREPVNPPSTVMPTAVARDILQPTSDATPQRPHATPRIQPRPSIVTSAQMPEMAARAAPTPAPATVSPAASASAATRPTPFHPLPVPVQPAPIPSPARPVPAPTGEISNDTALLPPVKLSMLMWDDVPSKRFVILNGQRMAEGDRYGAVTVITIERAGVVVEGNGAKARVPLP